MARPTLSPRVRRSVAGATLAGLLLTSAVALSAVSAADPAGGAHRGSAHRSTAAASKPASTATSRPARRADNPLTPGNLTGLGFDQCHTPSQWQMNRWLLHSPYLAVGVYMSGDSRACLDQPNLTPTWVARQLAKGWRILAIHLGPQASCQPRFPRYGTDVTINPRPGNNGLYSAARQQGLDEATDAVSAAVALGLAAGSTIWYDLEGYNSDNDPCRESALAFLSAWTTQLHALGWVSGVYSSAGSGIAALDDARVERPGAFDLPDQIWLARYDGRGNTSTKYIRNDGWRPHQRIKQFMGGHDETWGGVRINVDRDFVDVGTGSVGVPETHCDGTKIAFWAYDVLRPPTPDYTPPAPKVKALQCLLQEQELYHAQITGVLNEPTMRAWRAWQAKVGMVEQDVWTVGNWMSLLSYGYHPIIKFGSADPSVRRLQRALNAARPTLHLNATGVFDLPTSAGLKDYQVAMGLEPSAVAGPQTWRALGRGLH